MTDDFAGSSIDTGKWVLPASGGSCDRDGTWRLQSGKLNLYGSASGDDSVLRTVAYTDMRESVGPSAQRVAASVTRAQTGHKYRLIANWVEVDGVSGGSEDKYLYCEFDDSTGTTVTFSLGLSQSCGTDTVYETKTVTLESGQENIRMCLYVLDTGVDDEGQANDDDILVGSFTYGSVVPSDTRGATLLRTTDYTVLNDTPGSQTSYAGVLGTLGGSNYTTIDSTWYMDDFEFEVGLVPNPDNNCDNCGDEASLPITPKCGVCTNSPSDTTPENLKVVIPGSDPVSGTYVLSMSGSAGFSYFYGWMGGSGTACTCTWSTLVDSSCAQSSMGDPTEVDKVSVCLYPGTGADYGKTVVAVQFAMLSIPDVQYKSAFTTSATFDCEEFFEEEKSLACNSWISWLSFTGRPCYYCTGPATVIAI